MTSYKQDPPFSIQIELTKGCNLQCSFCGINGFQERPNTGLQYMNLTIAKILAEQIADAGWNSRLEFAMHGEPTLNTNTLEIIRIFRNRLPKSQIMMTSNGGGIVYSKNIQTWIMSYFKNGGDILAIDEYQGVNLVSKIKAGIDTFELELEGIKVCNYPEDKQGNPHRRIKGKLLTFISPIDITDKGVHATLNNHCGSGSELDYSMNEKLCAKPFREISVNFDGSINLCCNDFIGEFLAGEIIFEDIEEIWNNKYFTSARKLLMDRDRSKLRPCRGCNAKSYRVGLLPDKLGKVKLDTPVLQDLINVKEATIAGPSRGPTKRARGNIIPSLTVDERWL